MNPLKGSITLSILTSFLLLLRCSATDTLAAGQLLRDGDVLISGGQNFALGFFSPANSTHRYVGIWYHKVPELTVVWVANRDAPLNDSSGFLSVTSKAGLVLYGHNGSVPVWSATVSDGNSSAAARILENGNLVLVRQDDRSVGWQSFDSPGDTFLPGMKLGMDKVLGLSWSLTSWKSTNDPAKGNVSFRFDPTGYPELFLYQGGVRLWRAGPWTGQRLSGVPEMTSNYIFRVMFVEDRNGFRISYNLTNSSIISRMMVDGSGVIARYTWSEANRQWIKFWSDPKEQCDRYGVCGPNSNCDPYQADTFMCKCLPGFVPKSPSDWYLRDGSAGCVRDPGVSTCQTGEGFVKLARIRVPETAAARINSTTTLKACEDECLRNCSCGGYAVADTVKRSGCLTWYGDLVDIRTYSSESDDIFVRVDAETLASYGKSKSPLANNGVKAIVIISIIIALFLLVCLVICCIRRRRKAKEKRHQFSFEFSQLSSSSTARGESPGGKAYSEKGSHDLPFFDLSTIAAATNNFANVNKLGEGGFGSVYKGLLENGRDIAVKRLSKNSGQGVDEFRNEVTLIAKLQHRNLVRILGYCTQGEEKMLVYEYLPNNSLDSIIFDEEKRSRLDWPMRFNIICGIARGILYLHQDSRLRIIHRDLKASNVLLDASMNPKISDFGMAKIFGADQIEANTMRIVGTYGYMSPEYAMHGIFSVKSDVYSFGVLLLEIITGRKNRTYYESDGSTYLVGYVWELWKEGRALEIVDPKLGDSFPKGQPSRCIQIGLLCVQESAAERPTMSSVVFMLSNVESDLKPPGKPAFILKEVGRSGDPSTSDGAASVNNVTITTLQAR